jgi:hypothetical protein
MNESESPVNVEEQVERFRSEIETLESPVRVLDPADFNSQEELKTPKDYYLSSVVCDNCANEVYLWVRQGIPVPKALPAEPCPTCRVTGSIFRPMTEKEMFDEARRRFGS